jgi:hypothetical protein
MISFGLRTRPEAKLLQVRSELLADCVAFSVTGDWTPDLTSAREAGATKHWRRKSLVDLTLGDTVIERVIAKGHGTYRCELDKAFRLEFSLPVKSYQELDHGMDTRHS